MFIHIQVSLFFSCFLLQGLARVFSEEKFISVHNMKPTLEKKNLISVTYSTENERKIILLHN